jgi:hypothetical protein
MTTVATPTTGSKTNAAIIPSTPSQTIATRQNTTAKTKDVVHAPFLDHPDLQNPGIVSHTPKKMSLCPSFIKHGVLRGSEYPTSLL